ncbi:MAG: hypothetical protein WD053_06880 [Gracilimonas sp.]
MNTFESRKVSLLLVFILSLVFISCGGNESETGRPDISDIRTFTTQEIFSMSEVDSIYFSHLGYQSVVLENGNIAIPDREIPNITIINEDGELQKVIREGRGPGEILDAYQFTKNTGSYIYTYDQHNDKLIEYDENFDLVREIIPPNYEATSLLKAYPTKLDGKLIFELMSMEFLRNEEKEREIILIQYDSETESYGEEKILKAQPYARFIEDGQSRGAGLIPYSYGNLTAHNIEDKTLFTFDTATNLIAEIDADFDTVRTITVNLPTEEISSTERDSMETAYDDLRWNTLKDVLPKVKASVNNMIYHKGEFWMESNILGETEMWLVLNTQGQITRVVHFPKDSMLMHISDEHLGVRLDDVTFALFTNPRSEVR